MSNSDATPRSRLQATLTDATLRCHTQMPHPDPGSRPHSEMPHSEMPHSQMPHSQMPYSDATLRCHTQIPAPGHTHRCHTQMPHSDATPRSRLQATPRCHIQTRFQDVPTCPGCRPQTHSKATLGRHNQKPAPDSTGNRDHSEISGHPVPIQPKPQWTAQADNIQGRRSQVNLTKKKPSKK
ncbi:hypothetical protein B0T17DRAFT_169024 [Bombardia bombarda]|uniref:Uncharacterized protein n=1 Tax=Bombardia bombarda TaxID=252184 RepID=A0AA39X7R0_9PEZI|nr:hypothetical protein B0T17DRAFT_169024 [Bombardia bombarda]